MPADPIADELAIRRLVDRYCDGVNRRDPATWASVWAEEGAEWDLAGRLLSGKHTIVSFWVAAVARYELLVQVATNGVVDLGGGQGGEGADVATGRWYVSETGRLAGGEGQQLLAAYDDRYVRTPDGWRIQRRALEVLYRGTEAVPGWAKPVGDTSSA